MCALAISDFSPIYSRLQKIFCNRRSFFFWTLIFWLSHSRKHVVTIIHYVFFFLCHLFSLQTKYELWFFAALSLRSNEQKIYKLYKVGLLPYFSMVFISPTRISFSHIKNTKKKIPLKVKLTKLSNLPHFNFKKGVIIPQMSLFFKFDWFETETNEI